MCFRSDGCVFCEMRKLPYSYYFVDLLYKNGGFPVRYVNVYQRVCFKILNLNNSRT